MRTLADGTGFNCRQHRTRVHLQRLQAEQSIKGTVPDHFKLRHFVKIYRVQAAEYDAVERLSGKIGQGVATHVYDLQMAQAAEGSCGEVLQLVVLQIKLHELRNKGSVALESRGSDLYDLVMSHAQNLDLSAKTEGGKSDQSIIAQIKTGQLWRVLKGWHGHQLITLKVEMLQDTQSNKRSWKELAKLIAGEIKRFQMHEVCKSLVSH
eukprot:GHVO01001097.1.p2 GENE.GHVO01001097.1~~GHVO01001097.1.p2  ORF type:complete len:208 (+),score=24.79 GHVO01001097.1:152-775(+)